MLSSKVDPRSVINYGTNIIAPSKVQDIYHKANVYFQKYKRERITYRTFYISKGFDVTDGKGKVIEHVCKGVREKHPAQGDDSTKWRRIDYLPKKWSGYDGFKDVNCIPIRDFSHRSKEETRAFIEKFIDELGEGS